MFRKKSNEPKKTYRNKVTKSAVSWKNYKKNQTLKCLKVQAVTYIHFNKRRREERISVDQLCQNSSIIAT